MKFQQIRLESAQGAEVDLVNQAYGLWLETYTPISQAAGAMLKPESFHRSHILNVIHRDGEVLSLSLSSIQRLDFAGADGLQYFAPMSVELREEVKREHPKVMSVEWITVHPRERQLISKIRQPDLILGCSLHRFFTSSDADLVMGYPRIDVGADRIAAQFGFVERELTTMFGIECRVMLGTRKMLKPHRFAIVQKAIDDLCNEPNRLQIAA